jgi:hypothetical protein
MENRRDGAAMTCSIKSHALIKRSPAAWSRLIYVGIQRFDGELLELRNCPHCSSTLAILLPVPAPVELAEGTNPGLAAAAEWEWNDATPVMTLEELATVPSAVSPAAPVHRLHDLLSDLWRMM